MDAQTIYLEIDRRLKEIILDKPEEFSKIKNEDEKKSRAFLYWFTDFYGIRRHGDTITDGPNDFGADVMFTLETPLGGVVDFIVQAKWCNESNSKKHIEEKEINLFLAQAEKLITSSEVTNANPQLARSHASLQNRLRENGKVRLIFLTLKKFNPAAEESLKLVQKKLGIEAIDVFDIERLKNDFIDFEYKNYRPAHRITFRDGNVSISAVLKIKRQFIDGGAPSAVEPDFLLYKGSKKTLIVTIGIETVYNLVKTYGYSVFAENVRNPLPVSEVNVEMLQTLKNEPDNFWYFNNGLTAIASKVDAPGLKAEEIKASGLQIINGAQTAFTLYEAYDDARPEYREVLKDKVWVTLRLVDSADKNFNLRITRYANSQNAVFERDFYANDPIQKRLQQESFVTNYWYETRRGEFSKNLPNNVEVISNERFAVPYYIFYLGRFHEALTYENKITKQIFLTKAEDSEGLYNIIFNEETHFEDMLASYFIFDLMYEKYYRYFTKNDNFIKKIKQYNDKHNLKPLSNPFIVALAVAKSIFEFEAKNAKKSLTTFILDLQNANYGDFSKLIEFSIYLFFKADRDPNQLKARPGAIDALMIEIEGLLENGTESKNKFTSSPFYEQMQKMKEQQ